MNRLADLLDSVAEILVVAVWVRVWQRLRRHQSTAKARQAAAATAIRVACQEDHPDFVLWSDELRVRP